MNAQQGEEVVRRANMLIGQWSLQNLTIPTIAREVFAMIANTGGPTLPYTIGSGGDFNTARPAVGSLIGAAYNLTASDPDVEVPITVYTDAAYQAIQIKDLSNTLISGVYYRPDFPLGKVFTWPVANTAQNTLVLYLRKPLVAFTSLTATYQLPDGAEQAIEDQLALQLAPSYSVPVDGELRGQARKSLSIFKRSNYKLFDLPQDPATTHDHGAFYNINTGSPA